jgi:DNA-binding MarR family transcriptional regulator
MAKLHKQELVNQVIIGAREFGISAVLFRHAVGEVLGVNVTDMECLALIFFKGLATPTELSEYTGLTSGATTAMLDRLERAGLIERRPNPHDRRGTLIFIRKEAVNEVGPLFESSRKAQDALVSSYSEQDLELLSEFFNRFTTLWEEERKKLQRLNQENLKVQGKRHAQRAVA